MVKIFKNAKLATVFVLAILQILGGIILPLSSAKAALSAVSATNDPVTGFPLWYQDINGLKLSLGADPNDPMQLAAPIIAGNAFSAQTGFGDEAFYWSGTASIPVSGGGTADLIMGLEAAYAGTGEPASGEQMVFTRIRVRIDAPVAGDYVVTHPYGSKTYTVTTPGVRAINDTIDIGTVPINLSPTAFSLALNGDIDPFLTAVAPAAPAGYIGSPLIQQTVTGSPTGNNLFRVEGPAGSNLDGAGNSTLETNLFALSGKLFVGPEPQSVTINGMTTTDTTPSISGTVSDATATVSVVVNGITYPATVTGNTWSANLTTALAVGTYDVAVNATNAGGSFTDTTLDELIINLPSSVGLAAVSPTVDPTNGFPEWYQDTNGLFLQLCKDPADPMCLAFPVVPGNAFSSQTGFGDEAFYWNGVSRIDLPNGGLAELILGLEAAYLNGAPADGDQMVFSRVRIRIDAPVAGDYTVTHPYGAKTYTVTTPGPSAINDTIDIGAVSIGQLATAFNVALGGDIGPFLTAANPLPPVGYIGNPLIEQTVTGSPTGNNFFRIQGPAGSNLSGAGNTTVQKDTFTLSGKILAGAVPLGVSVNTLATVNTNPTITGAVTDPAASVSISVGGQGPIAATINPDGSWNAAIPAPLAVGTYDVIAAATTATASASDTTTNELTISDPAVAPSVTVNSQTSTTAAPTVTGTVSDTTATVTITVGGQGPTAATVNPDGSWSATIATALTNGTYDVAASATNTAGTGNDTTVNELNINVAAVPTSPTVTIYPQTSHVANVTITGTVSDPSANVEVRAAGQGPVVATVNLNGEWSASLPDPVANGTYNVLVTATNAGGTGTDTTTDELIVDIPLLPVISVVTPIANLTNDATPQITITSNAAGTISMTGGCTPQSTVAVAGENTITFNTLANGVYDSCAVTVTNANAESSAPLAIPPFEINTAITDPNVNQQTTNSPAPELTGNVSDPDATVEVEVIDANDNVVFTGPAQNRGDGTWRLQAGDITPALADGTYSIEVISTALSGSKTSFQLNNALIVDITEPVVTVSTLSTLDTTPALDGTVDDPNAEVKIAIHPKGQPLVISYEGLATNNGDGTWTLADNTIDPPLAENFYDISVEATDTAGNKGNDATSDELTIGNPPVATTMTISPLNQATDVGQTIQFMADVKDQNGTSMNVQVNWSNDINTVGSINQNTGLYTAIGAGTDTVTASYGGLTANTGITVNAGEPEPALTTIDVTPKNSAVNVGSTATFSAALKDQLGNPITGTVQWSSSDQTVATIEAASGVLTAIKAGTTTITATSGSVTGSTVVTINATTPPAGGGQTPQGEIEDTTEAPEVEDIRKNGAVISWTTPTPTITKIYFANKRGKVSGKQLKKKKGYSRVQDEIPTTNHVVNFTTLKKNKKYYYRIVTINPDGSESVSSIKVFKTKKK